MMSQNSSSDPSHDEGREEIDFATSLDDFQIDSSSGIPKPAASENDGPSIDDFQLVSNQVPATSKPASKRDEWFTRVLGQELGPFPFEQLVHMVSEGEIERDVELRPGFSDTWMIAGEIEGLFPEEIETDDDDFELDENFGESAHGTVISADQPEQNRASFKAVGGDINRAMSHRNAPRPAASTPLPTDEHDEQQEQAVPADESFEVAAEAVAPQKLTKEEKAALRKQEIAAKLNSWLEDKVPVEQKPEPDAEPEGEPVASATTAPANPYAPTGHPSPAAYNTPSAYTPPAAVAPKPDFSKFKKAKSSSGESMFAGLGSIFSGMSAPDVKADPKMLIILGVIGLVFAALYLPSFLGGTNDQKIYDRFKEIYAQIVQARTSNPGQLSAFKGTLVPEIKEIVDALEKAGAGASKPAKQQLFWAGRNCLIPILESPSPEANVYDERFKTHMDTAGRILGDPSVPPPAPPPTATNEDGTSTGTTSGTP